MSEKRFKYGRAFPINSDDSLPCITDRQDEKDYVRMNDLVDLLNEQQAEIERLQKKIDNISNSYEKFYGVKLKYAHWLQGDD